MNFLTVYFHQRPSDVTLSANVALERLFASMNPQMHSQSRTMSETPPALLALERLLLRMHPQVALVHPPSPGPGATNFANERFLAGVNAHVPLQVVIGFPANFAHG